MNSYNIFNENEAGTILFHAIASSEQHVKELASDSGIDRTGLTIELERQNVKDQLGRPFPASIENALIHLA